MVTQDSPHDYFAAQLPLGITRRRPATGLAPDDFWEVTSHFDAVLDCLTDHAILTLDTLGNVTSWNRGASRTKGYTHAEIIGQHFSCFYTKSDQDADVPMQALRLADELGKHEAEGWRVRKSGDLFWANVVIHPLRDLTGTLKGFVKVTRDASQRLQVDNLRAELMHSQKLEMVGQLTGGVAHDFKNLLTTIEVSHGLIQQYSSDERVTRVLDLSREAVGRSKKLIGQLLAFSRRQVLTPVVSNIFSLILSLDALVQRAVGEQIRLRWKLVPELPKVLVDQAQLQAVVMNLVVNARDAMQEGGLLTIFMDKVFISGASYSPPYDIAPGEYVVFGVSDTGCGMSPELQRRAIEPFFTTKRPGRSTGLGLSQCYGFARQSGGTLQIESAAGKGSTIRVLLPVAEPCRDAQAAGRPRTILFVDDDDCVRTLVSEALRDKGHNVIEAADGKSALTLLEQNASVDYLITDVMMPNDMNGVELMIAARAARPGLTTLLASGYPKEILRSLGHVPEDVMFIAKPYSLLDLDAHITG